MRDGKTALSKARPGRPYYPKVRSGCKTCKIRRIRCDEEKPACKRCLSTGRKCDDYLSDSSLNATKASSATKTLLDTTKRHVISPFSTLHGGKLALPRVNTEELRSYQFFLKVAAPSLAGVCDTDLWLHEIPRACHADPAIWHAVVSLGASYESWANSTAAPNLNVFALQQSHLSIKSLTEESYRYEDKWRALTASVIFSCICILQDLHHEARLHITAGCNLLHELQQEVSPEGSQKGLNGEHKSSPAIPVSIAPMHAIVAKMEVHARALAVGAAFYDKHSLVADDESFNVWRFYQSPSSSVFRGGSDKDELRYATDQNLIRANRAAAALLNRIIVFSQQHAKEIQAAMAENDPDALNTLTSLQEPLFQCFCQLSSAIRIFLKEINSLTSERKYSPPIKPLLHLRLAHAMIRLLLFRDFRTPDQSEQLRVLAEHYKTMVDLVEAILAIDAQEYKVFEASPSTIQALYLVVHSGFPQSTRRRAIDVLRRYPRREGLWDSQFAVELANSVMKVESTPHRPVSGSNSSSNDHHPITKYTNNTSDTAEEDDEYDDAEIVPLRPRHFTKRVSFKAKRKAILSLRTWDDMKYGTEGTQCELNW